MSDENRHNLIDIREENGWMMEYLPQPGQNHVNVVFLVGYNVYFYFLFSGLLTRPKTEDFIYSQMLKMGYFEEKHWDTYLETRIFFWLTACLRYMIKKGVYLDVAEVMLNAGKDRNEAHKKIPWFLEESKKGNLPNINDIKIQCELLDSDIKNLTRLQEDKKNITIDKTELRKLHPKPFPIIFINEVPQKEIIAQMCIWGLRTGQKENKSLITYILNYLNEIIPNYLNEIIQKHPKIKVGDKERYLWDIYDALTKNWKAPLSNWSFRSYINNTLTGLILNDFNKGKLDDLAENAYVKENKEPLDDSADCVQGDYSDFGTVRGKSPETPSFPLTIWKAAELFYYFDNPEIQFDKKLDLNVLIRWIYRQVNSGKIKNAGRSSEHITQEGITKPVNQYLIDKEGYEALIRLWKSKGNAARKLRSCIINRKSEEMGWAVRYA
ncbi:MAG: hypothetical protein NTX88_00600, partial [Candidatus Atribacteria bacterium]|nr:hypothetical protein [Candidatus Atribacteria bacterium]